MLITSVLSINATPIDIPTDIELTIPYTGGNALLDSQLQGDYSVLNDAIPTFYLNVDGGEQLGCTNSEATNYNFEATQDDGSCEFNIASSNQVTTCGGIFVDSGGSIGDYSDNENQIITIYPQNTNEYVSLYFSDFEFEGC